jgi:hypothetical protein
MNRVTDLFASYRFIKLLVTDFKKLPGYKLGIFDENGNRKVNPETGKPDKLESSKEKNAYTVFHKLVFNIRRILKKIPLIGTTLGSYATALYLLKDTFKESADLENVFLDYLHENHNIKSNLIESNEIQNLSKGTYKLKNDVMYKTEQNDYEYIQNESLVYNIQNQEPIDVVMGIEIFEVFDSEDNRIFVSLKDLEKVSEEIANVTGTGVAGTGDDSSVVVVRDKKKRKKEMEVFKRNGTV